MDKKCVSIIVPCFQEERNIEALFSEVNILFNSIKENFSLELIIVDDGSTDQSLNKLLDFKKDVEYKVRIVKFSGNFGSYSAYMAGLKIASGDCFIQLHCDLQDPPQYIPQMLEHWKNGYKYVIANREKRNDGFIYLLAAKLYHKLIKKIALPNIPQGGYELVLIDNEIREELLNMDVRNTNIMYLISWMKYPYVTIPIKREKRKNGKSNYNFSRRYKLFIDTVTSLSYVPIKAISLVAFINFISWIFFSLAYLFQLVNTQLIFWLIYTVLTFLFLSVSIIGEYLWRSYQASMKKPLYFIDKVYD